MTSQSGPERARETYVESLSPSVQVGFAVHAVPSGELTYVSPGFVTIFGYNPLDAAEVDPGGQLLRDRIHPDDWVRFISDSGIVEPVRATVNGRQVDGQNAEMPSPADPADDADNVDAVELEYRAVLADASTGWIRVKRTYLRDADGNPTHIASSFEDISRRKLAEEDLRVARDDALSAAAEMAETQLRFEQLAGSLSIGFHLASVRPPEFLYVSPGWVAMFGYDPTALDSPSRGVATVLEHVHSDDRERIEAMHRIPIEEWDGSPLEYRIVTVMGDVRWMSTTRIAVKDDAGVAIRVASVSEDVTARRAAQEAVLAARREAEVANAAKSEFLSRTSHELRTPLNAVLGFAQLLEMDPMSDAQKEAVHHILRGGRHLLAMIDDILDISRIEADQFEISSEPVQVAELIIDTLDLMRPLATETGVTLNYATQFADQTTFVNADQRRLAQVMLNLISNAIKYNRRHGRVDVSYTRRGAAELAIAIADTGIGVAPESLPRLFAPFDRLGLESSDISGTGIGLAVSQRLTQVMGGSIEVTSTLGIGSTFTLVLPLIETPPDSSGSTGSAGMAESEPEADAASESGSGSHRLLYIEDNLSNVQLMQRVIQRSSAWQMIHVGNGTLGLASALSSPPTLLLLDLHLPDMHGSDVLRQLRADPRTADLPVVILSADASPKQVARLTALGIDDYLTKPLVIRDMLSLLDGYAGVAEAS